MYQEDVSEAGSDVGGEAAQLREQLATLTSSLTTLMQEKSKMEGSYQAEKKKLLVCK